MTALERLAAAGFEVPGAPQPESRYFPPTDRCPHPERWHSTDGDSTELEVGELVAAFVRALQPDHVVETGAAFGITTEQIAVALVRNGRGHLYALEHDEHRADAVEERLGGYYRAWASVIRASSLEWSPFPALIDLLFSDTNYETRVPEVLRFLPHLRPDATVIFHDTGRGSHRLSDGRSLRQEIEDELIRPGFLSAVDLPTPRGLTICQRLTPA